MGIFIINLLEVFFKKFYSFDSTPRDFKSYYLWLTWSSEENWRHFDYRRLERNEWILFGAHKSLVQIWEMFRVTFWNIYIDYFYSIYLNFFFKASLHLSLTHNGEIANLKLLEKIIGIFIRNLLGVIFKNRFVSLDYSRF